MDTKEEKEIEGPCVMKKGYNEKEQLKKKTFKIMKSKRIFIDELRKRRSSSDCEKVWRDSHKRLYRMLAEHQSLPKGVALHTDNFIFPAASIYLAMKEVCPDIAYDVMKKTMAEKSTGTGKKIAGCCKIPGFKKIFLGMWDPISHKMFGESSGFKNVFYPKEKRSFRMDVTQCPYHTYLTETGCPELNILFCKNDEYAYGNLPGIRFTRTGTIATGNERCDFRKISGNPRLSNCRDESAKRNKARKERLFCFFLPCLLLCDILYV